jgi:hypothetical protein
MSKGKNKEKAVRVLGWAAFFSMSKEQRAMSKGGKGFAHC